MIRTARLTVTAVTAAVLALGVSACGGDDSAATGSNGGGSGSADGDTAAALEAAARTATDEVAGTLVGIDQGRDVWEVDIVADDGSETRVDVSADGSAVEDQRAEDVDAEDQAENQRLLDAQVDWVEALGTARAELGEGVDELDLGEDDGRLTWEASVPGDGAGSTVVIDADSGEVIGTDD